MKRVTVVDYGAGNVYSVVKALIHLGCAVEVAEDADTVAYAERVVLPGVGHFSATDHMRKNGVELAVRERIGNGTPFLGICVGLQWLFEGSAEAAGVAGAAILPGSCFRLSGDVKVPHVGWNSLQQTRPSWLLHGLADDSQVYFTHSYAAPVVKETVSVTEHGKPFTAALERGRMAAVQFHPEKSGETGLQVLRNFLELPC